MGLILKERRASDSYFFKEVKFSEIQEEALALKEGVVQGKSNCSYTGNRRIFDLRPGIQLLLDDVGLKIPVRAELDDASSFLEFCFFISGVVRCEIKGLGIPVEMGAGHCNLSFIHNPEGKMEYFPDQRLVVVAVRINPLTLAEFMEAESRQLPSPLMAIAGNKPCLYCETAIITPAIQMVVHQILNCPYTGSLGKMYMESKAVELVIHTLARIAESRSEKAGLQRLVPSDIERIHEAGRVLTQNLQNPPS